MSYEIEHEEGLATGTEIRNVATIQFDDDLEIDTNQVNPLEPSEGAVRIWNPWSP